MGDKISKLIEMRKKPIVGKLIFNLLKLYGMEVPLPVKIGQNVEFVHSGIGVVLHPTTVIEDNVKIFHGVTIGRADVYNTGQKTKMKGIIIGEGAIIGAGAKILGKSGYLTVGKNTIIGANSVLLKSTGDNEIWAGNPAKKIKDR
jgi:serine O-acetyltransferase